ESRKEEEEQQDGGRRRKIYSQGEGRKTLDVIDIFFPSTFQSIERAVSLFPPCPDTRADTVKAGHRATTCKSTPLLHTTCLRRGTMIPTTMSTFLSPRIANPGLLRSEPLLMTVGAGNMAGS